MIAIVLVLAVWLIGAGVGVYMQSIDDRQYQRYGGLYPWRIWKWFKQWARGGKDG